MNQKHFCNPYRVLDATTQYILKKVIGEGSSKLEEVVFRVILFDIFTKPATWEKLCENLGGIPKWEGGRGMQGLGQANGKAKSRSVKELGDTTVYSRESYGRILSEIHETDAIYTGAFQKPGGKFGYRAPHMNHLCVLESFMDNGLPEVLATAGEPSFLSVSAILNLITTQITWLMFSSSSLDSLAWASSTAINYF